MVEDTVVNRMLEALNKKVSEIREIYTTLSTIRKYGVEFDLPELQDLFVDSENHSQVSGSKARPDEYFGQSNTVAAENYLRKIGHAEPLTDIYDALVKGGISFSGDGKKNLYTQLTRATRKFVRIASGEGVSFGLIDWYPKPRKGQGKNESANGLSHYEDATDDDNPETEIRDEIEKI